MDIRNGKCFDCGAEYQIPASFPHDVARCKQCGSAVHIAKVGEPMPTPPPKAAPPAPAKKVAPRAAERPALEEYKPSGKKGDGPSMLERLKAQRAADDDAAPARPKAEARRTTAAKVAGIGGGAAMRPAAKARQQAAASSGRSPSGATPGRPSSRVPAGKSGGRGSAGTRNRTTERGGRARPEREEKKKTNVVGLVAILLIVALAAGAFFFRDQLFGGGTAAEAAETDVAANDQGAEDAATTDEDAATDESGEAVAADEMVPPPADDDRSTSADGTSAEGADEDAGAATGDDATAAADEGEPAAPDMGPDISQLPEIGPILTTTGEQWTEMNELLAEWSDPWAGSAGARAGNRLTEEFGVLAMPVMVNHLRTLDLTTKEGYDVAYQIKEKLKELVFGRNFGWKSWNEPDYQEKGVGFNRKVVELWHSQVQKIADQGIDYYIGFAKLEMKTSSDSDEYANPERAKLAAELRAKYGDGSTPAPDEGSIEVPKGDDDLDID